MEIINEVLSQFFNNELVQHIIEIALGLLSILKIISSTSIGQKALKKLETLHEQKNVKLQEAQTRYDETVNKVDELVAVKDEEIAALKEEANAKYQLLYNNFNEKIDVIFNALSKINNEQIKNIVNEYKNLAQVQKEVVISELADKASKYDELIKRIEALENERKETINDSSEEE